MVQSQADIDREVDDAQAQQIRDPHEQRLSLLDAQLPRSVENVQVVAFFNPESIKFDKFHSLNVTLTIPREFVERALELRHMAGFPLSVDFQKWIAPMLDQVDGQDQDGEGD